MVSMATFQGAAASSAAHVAYDPPWALHIDGHVRAVTPCSVSSVSTSSGDQVRVSTTNKDRVQFGPADGAGYGLPETLNGLPCTDSTKLHAATIVATTDATCVGMMEATAAPR